MSDGFLDPNIDIPIPVRIKKVEDQVKENVDHLKTQDDKIESLDRRIENVEGQMGRLMSHIESELGLARRDIIRLDTGNTAQMTRIESRLFGQEDEEYGGRLGALNKRMHRFEVWILAVITSATILGFIFGAYYFVTAVMNKKGG